MAEKILKPEQYRGYKIEFVKGKKGIVFGRCPVISSQFLGYGKTKEEVFNMIKDIIDTFDKKLKLTNNVISKTKTMLCDYNDLPKANDEVERYKSKDKLLIIVYDTEPESPREWDNLGIMVCYHPQYNLGDEQIDIHNFSSWSEVEEWIIDKYKPYRKILLPLYLYDHSILRIKVGDYSGLLPQGHAEFDTSKVGYIFTTKQKIKSMLGVNEPSKERIIKLLTEEVKVYDDYLSGQVYGYQLYQCKNGTWELVDSCYGYFGESGKEQILDELGGKWEEID